MEIADLLAYSDAGIDRLHVTLVAHPEPFDAKFETISNFKSIRDLVSHMIGAEERWLGRMQQCAHSERYEDRAASTVDGIFSDWHALRQNTRSYLASLDDNSLVSAIPIVSAGRQHPVLMTPVQVVYHLVNHQTFHTGQISTILQRISIDPPNFDYAALSF